MDQQQDCYAKSKRLTIHRGQTNETYLMGCRCGWTCKAKTERLIKMKRRLHNKYCSFTDYNNTPTEHNTYNLGSRNHTSNTLVIRH